MLVSWVQSKRAAKLCYRARSSHAMGTWAKLSRGVVQISTSAAPACGSSGARSVAMQAAAIETLRQGYDGYVVLGLGSDNNVRVVGVTPVTAYSNYNIWKLH